MPIKLVRGSQGPPLTAEDIDTIIAGLQRTLPKDDLNSAETQLVIRELEDEAERDRAERFDAQMARVARGLREAFEAEREQRKLKERRENIAVALILLAILLLSIGFVALGL